MDGKRTQLICMGENDNPFWHIPKFWVWTHTHTHSQAAAAAFATGYLVISKHMNRMIRYVLLLFFSRAPLCVYFFDFVDVVSVCLLPTLPPLSLALASEVFVFNAQTWCMCIQCTYKFHGIWHKWDWISCICILIDRPVDRGTMEEGWHFNKWISWI